MHTGEESYVDNYTYDNKPNPMFSLRNAIFTDGFDANWSSENNVLTETRTITNQHPKTNTYQYKYNGDKVERIMSELHFGGMINPGRLMYKDTFNLVYKQFNL